MQSTPKQPPACNACQLDEHAPFPARPSVIQVLGINLCQHHYDTMIIIKGRVMPPGTVIATSDEYA
jgi:hypothetical protein